MIDRHKKKVLGRESRHRRIRAKVSGTAERPRLCVFRSATHIYAQVIDDVTGRTLVSGDDRQIDAKKVSEGKGEGGRGGKTAMAYAVGMEIAEKAKKSGISQVVFDRNGFAYSGRVAALGQGARDGGLVF
ncbi:50S ribosomal protein L18 [Candidatus Uhrbacteria bacterium]|nr:50S ribosomal protein L18 [Candidatus Uhrbacteria bacterium]